jgi:purine-cytosine permease-like protein
VLATAISLVINLTQYQQFLLLLGAFFVPLFGVLLADWLAAGRHYTREDVFGGPLWRPGMIGAWLVGFGLYEWIAQTQDLGFWSRGLSHLHPPQGGIGASLPSFAAFALAFVVARARHN